MSKLNDIVCYWDMSGCNKFNYNDMWIGKIILEDDGWFEGIVNNPNSSFQGNRMVFGIYHPNKVIELLKISPKNVSDPFVFYGIRDDKGYSGDFSVIGLKKEIPYGVSHIITRDVALFKENEFSKIKNRNIVVETKELMKQLKKFKTSNSDKNLYENTLAMRSSMSKIVLQNYENYILTGEKFDSFQSISEDKQKKLIRHINTNDSLPL